MINAIILASGYGTRMGENKLLLPYKNKTIIEHVIDVISSYSFDDVVLVGREDKILDLAKNRIIKTVVNNNANNGQSESIKLGIKNSSPSDGYMFFTGDQPLIDIETITLLVDSFYKNSNSIIVPIYKENRGSPVIFPKEFKDELLNLEGDVGGKKIINTHIDRVDFAKLHKDYVLFDIDTPEDYQTLLKMNL